MNRSYSSTGSMTGGSVDDSSNYEKTGEYAPVKSKRRQRDYDSNCSNSNAKIEENLMNLAFPPEYEEEVALAVFEYGLRQSSPKLLISLMPQFSGLNTEHIKSHLQKYRIHHERSKEEFLSFYNNYLKDSFRVWLSKRGWDTSSRRKPRVESNDQYYKYSNELSSQDPLKSIVRNKQASYHESNKRVRMDSNASLLDSNEDLREIPNDNFVSRSRDTSREVVSIAVDGPLDISQRSVTIAGLEETEQLFLTWNKLYANTIQDYNKLITQLSPSDLELGVDKDKGKENP